MERLIFGILLGVFIGAVMVIVFACIALESRIDEQDQKEYEEYKENKE